MSLLNTRLDQGPPSRMSLRTGMQLVRASNAVRDPDPEKITGRILERLDTISFATEAVEPGPYTREKRRLEETSLWKKSSSKPVASLDLAADTDSTELSSEFAFSPNPLWGKSVGFVQRKSPLTRRLDSLKLSAAPSPPPRPGAGRSSDRSPAKKPTPGSSAHREGGRSIGPVKGGGSGKSYLRSGASPGIVKPTGLIPFAAHLSTEIRHRSSPRIAAAAAAAVRSKGVRWSTALAAQRAGTEVAADRTMRAGADSLHQQQQQVREGRKSQDSLDHLRELLASEQREASLEARTEMDG